MTIDMTDLLNSILKSIGRIDYVRPSDIPDIALYMDQVTTFMEEQLKDTKRYEEDKILTKTMINNYAKNNLLPPPVKKKYTKEHILVLIFIYYFKNILSIKDIERLLKPLTDHYFSSDEEYSMQFIYEKVCSMEKSRIQQMQESVKEMYGSAEKAYEESPKEGKEYLKLFAFICNLSFDVYVKRQIIEKLIDQLPEDTNRKDNKKTV